MTAEKHTPEPEIKNSLRSLFRQTGRQACCRCGRGVGTGSGSLRLIHTEVCFPKIKANFAVEPIAVTGLEYGQLGTVPAGITCGRLVVRTSPAITGMLWQDFFLDGSLQINKLDRI